MIGIQINGEFIDLFDNTTINIRLINPIFSMDVIAGSYSLPFPIPGGEVSNRNGRIFGQPDVVESIGNKLKIQNVILSFDHTPYRVGTLEINPVSGRMYVGNFIFGLRTLGNDFKNARLKLLMDENIVLSTTTYERKVFAKPKAGFSGPFRLQINGTTYEDVALGLLASAINDDDQDPDVTANELTVSPSPLGSCVPPYLEIYLTDFASDPNVEFIVTYAEVEDQFNWIIETSDISFYNSEINSGISLANSKTVFAFMFNRNLHMASSLRDCMVNLSDENGLVLNNPNKNLSGNDLFNFNLANGNVMRPFLLISYLFEIISSAFNQQFEGDFFDTDYYTKGLFFNTHILDKIIPYIGDRDFVLGGTSYNIADITPDMTIKELLIELSKRLNLTVYLNEQNNYIRIQQRDTIFSDNSYLDITERVSPVGNLDYISYSGVRLNTEPAEKDLLSVIDVFDQGIIEHEIPAIFNGLDVELTRTTYATPSQTGPIIDAAAYEDLPYRLMFYNGLIDNGINDYPQAKIGLQPLHFNGSGNLGETVYKKYLNFLINRKQASYSIRFDFRDILNFNWEQKYMVDRVKYFVKSLDVTLTMQGMETVKGELYSN